LHFAVEWAKDMKKTDRDDAMQARKAAALKKGLAD
jgi:hypothetical protein